MMRRLILTLSVLLLTAVVWAVPAKRGQWRMLKLTDGTEVRAELRGDESCHYWQTEDGTCIVEQDDGYAVVEDVTAWKTQSRKRHNTSARARAARRGLPDFPVYKGKKRGLIILAAFTNKMFARGHDQEFYDNVANTVGFTSKEGFIGSVHDYFLDQSYGEFDLTFDVAGPVQLSNTYKHYGENDNRGDDKRPGEMVAEACKLVDETVDFTKYDWNDDGMVDMVMVVYAGKGEANGGTADTIWPHEWALSDSDYGKLLMLDGMMLDTYACVSELASSGVDGIGTICHEFAHCLGLPDMYDLYTSNYGMGSWSPLDAGCYNGNTFCPASFTSFEKLSCGWIEPTVLSGDTTITTMKPLSSNGEAYLLPNEGYGDEFFLLENRQRTGWDASLPGQGLLILHVDYNEKVWVYNEVNSTSKKDVESGNDHQRCTIFHADNTTRFEGGDAYPYLKNNQLTAISKPAAKLHNANTDGQLFMSKAVTGITQNEDGTISFKVEPQQYGTDGISHIPVPPSPPAPAPIYSPDGRYLGTDLQRLKPGLYIVGGRKILK